MKRWTTPLAGLALLAGAGLVQAQTSGAPTSGTGDARQQMQPSTQGATSSGQMSSGQGMGGQAMGNPDPMPRKAKRKKKSRRH